MAKFTDILSEHARDKRLTRFTLSSGEEIIGFIISPHIDKDDELILINEDGEGNGPWITIFHIVTIQEWVIGDEISIPSLSQ
jgi:hypothetical protein